MSIGGNHLCTVTHWYSETLPLGVPIFERKITSKYFYRFINYISEIEIEPGTADFRLMDKKVAKVFFTFTENELFIRGLINWVGFKQFAIDYKPSDRFSGSSKYTVKKMLQFALKGITSFSIRPLYLSIFLGITLSLAVPL